MPRVVLYALNPVQVTLLQLLLGRLQGEDFNELATRAATW